MRRLLLISNSTQHGGGYLEHCEAEVRGLFEGCATITFVPYALFDCDGYADAARKAFQRMGFGLVSSHEASDPRAAIRDAEGLFVGGGNTFRLVKRLWDDGLVEPIRERVVVGVPYMGTSAGSNVATPSICTTNDMPIVEPPTFEALALVSFQINPHYVDPETGSTHMGETREQRIAEFHEENDGPVVGLREGGMLLVTDGSVSLLGPASMRLFRRGEDPVEFPPGSDLGFLGA